MGRLIPNILRVVQILLDITVKVSLKDYWHLPKELDYSLTLLVFVFGQSLTLFMLICILNDPVIQRLSYILVHYPPPPDPIVSNVVICGYSFTEYELMWSLRQEELLHLSIHNLT